VFQPSTGADQRILRQIFEISQKKEEVSPRHPKQQHLDTRPQHQRAHHVFRVALELGLDYWAPVVLARHHHTKANKIREVLHRIGLQGAIPQMHHNPTISSIWKSWTPPKCKFFARLITQNRVWSVDRLAAHGWQHDDSRVLCLRHMQYAHHLLADCRYQAHLGACGSLDGTTGLESCRLGIDSRHPAVVDYDHQSARHIDESTNKPFPTSHLGRYGKSEAHWPSIDPPLLH
jgi:hypothetical protein